MDERARQGVELGLGLAMLGVQRWMTVRPDVEAELERLGHTTAADVSRQVGDRLAKLLLDLATGAARR